MENQNIKKLTDREQARTKLPIFFGSFDNYTHSLSEMLANARDEIINNFDNGKIIVKIEKDKQTMSIFDTGRGIPLMNETNGEKNYVLLFETLFAGGNYENIEKGKFTTGTNGVGVACTNFTSDLFEVISYKNNKGYEVKYSNGGKFISYNEFDSDITNGTLIRWKLDDTIYTNITYDIEFIKNLINKLSSTTPNIEYSLYIENEDSSIEEIIYTYENQIDYLQNNCTNNLTEFIQFPFKNFEEQITKEGIELIERDNIQLALSLSSEPLQDTFLNGGYLKENGTILDGIIQGLKKSFSKELKKCKLTEQDILMSFNIHCIFNSTNPIFHSQTKFSASNQLYKKLATQYTFENIEIVKIEQPKIYNEFLKHIETINKFNTKNNDSIKKLKSTLNEKTNVFNKVDKLKECKSKDKDKRVLMICEGDSAMASLLSGRNDYQAVYPLRGKPLNSLKAQPQQILNNQVILDLIKVLGCGIELKNNKDFSLFDINNLNYSKIYIITDADVDGMGSILPLLLTIFYVLTPKLIEEGRVYLCETPKYEIECENKEYYAKNDNELEDILSQIRDKKHKINYVKGLAELSGNAMALCLQNKFDNIKQIKINDIIQDNKTLELFMGTNIQERKEYILNNFNKNFEL